MREGAGCGEAWSQAQMAAEDGVGDAGPETWSCVSSSEDPPEARVTGFK